MIVNINFKDKEHIEKVCVILDHYVQFFTNERNSNMLMAKVEWAKGVDLTPAQAYHFGRMVETYVFQEMMNKHL